MSGLPVRPAAAGARCRGAGRGRQVALFRTYDGAVYALDNQDPFSGANVLSRGIVGSRGDVPTVASPMYKQVFDLRTGACLDEPDVSVRDVPDRGRGRRGGRRWLARGR